MNNKGRVISENKRETVLRVIQTDRTLSISSHKVVDRRLALKPEMIIVNGQIWYDYTSIMMYAWETGQEAMIREGKTGGAR